MGASDGEYQLVLQGIVVTNSLSISSSKAFDIERELRNAASQIPVEIRECSQFTATIRKVTKGIIIGVSFEVENVAPMSPLQFFDIALTGRITHIF